MPTSFVIMPFGGYFDHYYSAVIKPTLEGVGLVSRRADEIYSTTAVMNDIYRAISDADLCIADLTDKNPNVSYELGVAHSLAKPVVMITQRIDDVPFDYRHLRIVRYDPLAIGWERALAEALTKTIAEVMKRPSDYVVFAGAATQEGKMRQHLINIFYSVDCVLDKYDVVVMDEAGNARARTTWTYDAHSDIYHLCENRAIESPGRIEVLRAYDKINGRHMEVVELERTPTLLSYLMFMTSFKRPGQRFVLETEMLLENYLGPLPRTGAVSMVHQAATRSKLKYQRLVEEFRLPKIPRYRRAYAEYVNHPDASMIGKRISAVEEADAYVITARYDPAKPFNHEVGVLIRDGRSTAPPRRKTQKPKPAIRRR